MCTLLQPIRMHASGLAGGRGCDAALTCRCQLQVTCLADCCFAGLSSVRPRRAKLRLCKANPCVAFAASSGGGEVGWAAPTNRATPLPRTRAGQEVEAVGGCSKAAGQDRRCKGAAAGCKVSRAVWFQQCCGGPRPAQPASVRMAGCIAVCGVGRGWGGVG